MGLQLRSIKACMSRTFLPLRWLGLLYLLLMVAGCGQKGPLTIANMEAEIRFYTLNSRTQQNQMILVPNAGRSGCSDLLIPRDVYRVAQIGFAYCEVYKARGCELGTEYTLTWSGTSQTSKESKSTTRITPGSQWLFAQNSTEKVGSWYCHTSGINIP